MYNYKIILNNGPVTRIRGTISLLVKFPELAPILDRYMSEGVMHLLLETAKGYLNILGEKSDENDTESNQKQLELFADEK